MGTAQKHNRNARIWQEFNTNTTGIQQENEKQQEAEHRVACMAPPIQFAALMKHKLPQLRTVNLCWFI